MSHLRSPDGTVLCEHEDEHEHDLLSPPKIPLGDHHKHGDEHDHSHGLVDRSILRSRPEVKAASLSLLILSLTAGAQVAIFLVSNSVALLEI